MGLALSGIGAKWDRWVYGAHGLSFGNRFSAADGTCHVGAWLHVATCHSAQRIASARMWRAETAAEESSKEKRKSAKHAERKAVNVKDEDEREPQW